VPQRLRPICAAGSLSVNRRRRQPQPQRDHAVARVRSTARRLGRPCHGLGRLDAGSRALLRQRVAHRVPGRWLASAGRDRERGRANDRGLRSEPHWNPKTARRRRSRDVSCDQSWGDCSFTGREHLLHGWQLLDQEGGAYGEYLDDRRASKESTTPRPSDSV
jgi:hypothetical protein